MRHALIRLWNQVGVDAKWFVPPGDSGVFDVTKRKFHVRILSTLMMHDGSWATRFFRLFCDL